MLLTKEDDLVIIKQGKNKGFPSQKQKVLIVCDVCDKKIKLLYATYINDIKKYNKNFCNSCKRQLVYNNNDGLKKWNEGDNNKSYKEKYGKDVAVKIKKKISDAMVGRNVGGTWQDVWNKEKNQKTFHMTYEERYGKEKSDKIKKKISNKTFGENNPMFGKPSPKGSGNGWSGWYNDIFFRSILELSYLKYLIDNEINFESAEKSKYAIEYNNGSIKRKYFPDFYLIDDDILIEVKPSKLINTEQNKQKFKEAKKRDNFLILTENEIEILSDEEIKKLTINKNIKWIKRYEKKYKEKYIF